LDDDNDDDDDDNDDDDVAAAADASAAVALAVDPPLEDLRELAFVAFELFEAEHVDDDVEFVDEVVFDVVEGVDERSNDDETE
jgi:hypothetical protein